jgi:plasmid stabilization system protein ParE
MKVTVREAAEDDLDRRCAWIGKDEPRAAVEMLSRIRDRIGLLEADNLAHMGRPGQVARTRELIEFPYIIVYTVDDERREVTVVSIVHGAQDRGRE